MNRCFLGLKFHSGSIDDLYLSPKCSLLDRVSHKHKRWHPGYSWYVELVAPSDHCQCVKCDFFMIHGNKLS